MRKWIPSLIIAAAIVASALVYPKLPETVPTHWDMSGHPNGWSSRAFGAWVLPVIMIVLWVQLWILPAIDPRGVNYAKFAGTFETIIDAILVYMLGVHLIILRASLGYPVPMQRIIPASVGVLLVLVGNLLPRARPNWFVGIRTPWTLSSDRVWEKTHRIGGRVFVAGGLLILLSALATPQLASIVLVTVVVLSTATVLIYSYVEWRREQSPASAAGQKGI